MALTTIKGVYRRGQVELAEPPGDVAEANILVTFLENGAATLPRAMMRLGQFRGPGQSTEEDFKLAEWHGEDDDA
jgi:hypothetical protein